MLQRNAMMDLLKHNLVKAHHRMKEFANKMRHHIEFKVGEWAFVKLNTYRQQSMRLQPYHKFGRCTLVHLRFLRELETWPINWIYWMRLELQRFLCFHATKMLECLIIKFHHCSSGMSGLFYRTLMKRFLFGMGVLSCKKVGTGLQDSWASCGRKYIAS